MSDNPYDWLADAHSVPYIALNAAEDLAMRSPAKGFASAPDALRRLIFPTPYAQMVLAEAHTRSGGLDWPELAAILGRRVWFHIPGVDVRSSTAEPNKNGGVCFRLPP